jgi:hypothetical protein
MLLIELDAFLVSLLILQALQVVPVTIVLCMRLVFALSCRYYNIVRKRFIRVLGINVELAVVSY